MQLSHVNMLTYIVMFTCNMNNMLHVNITLLCFHINSSHVNMYQAYWFDLFCMHWAEIFHHNIVHIPYTPFMTILGNMPWWADALNKHEKSQKMVMSCTVYTSFVLLAPDMQRHIYIYCTLLYGAKNVATSSSMYYYNVYYVHVRCMHVNVRFGLNALTCSKYENILWWHTI